MCPFLLLSLHFLRKSEVAGPQEMMEPHLMTENLLRALAWGSPTPFLSPSSFSQHPILSLCPEPGSYSVIPSARWEREGEERENLLLTPP